MDTIINLHLEDGETIEVQRGRSGRSQGRWIEFAKTFTIFGTDEQLDAITDALVAARQKGAA